MCAHMCVRGCMRTRACVCVVLFIFHLMCVNALRTLELGYYDCIIFFHVDKCRLLDINNDGSWVP
jgi:hypothetical protein